MSAQPSFVLDGSTLLTIGGVIGTLCGAIGFLFRSLISAKDQQIAAMAASTEARLAQSQREMEAQRAVMLAELEKLRIDRDYFRGLVVGTGTERRGGGRAPL